MSCGLPENTRCFLRRFGLIDKEANLFRAGLLMDTDIEDASDYELFAAGLNRDQICQLRHVFVFPKMHGRPFDYDEALAPFLVRLGLGDRLKGLLEADFVEIDDLICAPAVELLGAGLTRIQVSRLRRHSHDFGE
jgi:hypothetical protein